MLVERRRNPWKGLFAGALGGFAGSYAMSQFHKLLPKPTLPSSEKKEDSTVKAASAISQHMFHHELTTQQKKTAGPAVHYAFGISVGAMYGTLVEFAEPARAGWGLPFGTAVWLGAHVITVPALGLSKPVTQSAPLSEAAEFSAHLVYGVVGESVRRFLRSYLLC